MGEQRSEEQGYRPIHYKTLAACPYDMQRIAVRLGASFLRRKKQGTIVEHPSIRTKKSCGAIVDKLHLRTWL